MKRALIITIAALALAVGNPAASTAVQPDNPGQSSTHRPDSPGKSLEHRPATPCKKKGCGQPHGKSCKHANSHKTWCVPAAPEEGVPTT